MKTVPVKTDLSYTHWFSCPSIVSSSASTQKQGNFGRWRAQRRRQIEQMLYIMAIDLRRPSHQPIAFSLRCLSLGLLTTLFTRPFSVGF